MTGVVADTHTLVWYITESTKLSSIALQALDDATANSDLIYLSAISVVEICYLSERDRISPIVLERISQNIASSVPTIAIAPLSWSIACAIQDIDRATVPEMPDRIIAATALCLNLPLITCDHRIQALSNIQTVW